MKRTEPRPERPEWMNTTPCAQIDPELWFPKERDNVTASVAREVCFSCRHRLACLDYALDTNEPDGIWGGKTPGQRQRMRRERRAAA